VGSWHFQKVVVEVQLEEAGQWFKDSNILEEQNSRKIIKNQFSYSKK